MDYVIKIMTPAERNYCYTDSPQIDKLTGCIGHLRGDIRDRIDARRTAAIRFSGGNRRDFILLGGVFAGIGLIRRTQR